MKIKKTKIAVFFSAILVGFLIATNYNFKGTFSNLNLNAKEYQNAIETKNNLIKQVAGLRQLNSDTKAKIDKYSNIDVNSDKIIEDMKAQVVDYGMLTGFNEAKGPGLIITITDGKINSGEDTSDEAKRKILHDLDMQMVINEIRHAGAEAITINKHRISLSSSVVCNFAFLMFPDETTEYAPFNIYIIGNPKTLEASLFQQGSYLNRLKIRGLSIEIEHKDEIIMPATSNLELKNPNE